jgi:phosphoglycolate phosphatase
MKSVIFDLDGTLADTSTDLINAANACFVAMGRDAVLDPIGDALVGFHGGRAMLTLGFERLGMPVDADILNANYPLLLDHYEENIDAHTVLYNGVVPTLVELAARGYALGVCTNKPEYLATILIDRLGIADHFGAMLGADTLPVRKPDPEHVWETIRRLGGDLKKSALIGDTMTDRSAARNAGIPSVLVGFGPTGAQVADMEPEAILNNYFDLPDLMDQMIDA